MPEQHMVFSTHLDDDIIFMNNDIYDAIESGEPVTSVYLVSGTAERELGIKAAYAEMAGANDWVDETVVIDGKSIASSYLASNPDIRTYFLRFPDQGSGNSTSEQLYDGAVSSVTNDDGVSYTRDELTDTLTGLMDLHQPDNIMKHGAEIAANGGDHGEHIHFNDFVTDALEGYGTSHDVDDYLGYSVAGLDANITGEDYARKEAVFEAYGQYDANALNIPVFRDWLARQYQVGPDGQPVTEDWDIRGTPPTDENLITNGDFEDTSAGTGPGSTPVGWETTGARSGVFNASDARGEDNAYALGGWSGQGGQTLSQSVETVEGQSYDLGFDAGGAYGSFTGVLRVVADGANGPQTLATFSSDDLGNSAAYDLSFVAAGNETTISFIFDGTGGGDIDIDNVSLTAGDVVTPPDALNAQDETLQVVEDSWAVIGNVLDNDDGAGLRVIDGYNGFVGNAYLALAENGDIRISQRGEFDDLAGGETREIPISYTVEDADGNRDTATVTLEISGDGPPTPPPGPTGPEAVNDTLVVEEDSWAVIGNVLDNDAGDGLRVVGGYNGFVGNAYLAVAENGDVRLSQRGEFDDLAAGETREITLDYIIEDMFGEQDTAAFELILEGEAEEDDLVEIF